MTILRTYTPGPWNTDGIARHDNGTIGIFNESGVACIALIQPGCLPEAGRMDAAHANALLMASAPELLASLRECLALIEGPWRDAVTGPAISNAEHAIAHATERGTS